MSPSDKLLDGLFARAVTVGNELMSINREVHRLQADVLEFEDEFCFAEDIQKVAAALFAIAANLPLTFCQEYAKEARGQK